MNILERVQDIFRDIFDEDELIITMDTCADDIEDWDSLAQMNIMVTVAKEFNVRFSVEEIAGLNNVGDLVRAIENKLA